MYYDFDRTREHHHHHENSLSSVNIKHSSLYIPISLFIWVRLRHQPPTKGQTRTLTTAYASFQVATGYLVRYTMLLHVYTVSCLIHSCNLQSKKPDNCRDRVSSVYSFNPLTHYAQFRIQTERAMNYYAQFQLLKRDV